MKKLLQAILFFSVHVAFAQIEINPSSVNAELDLKSKTKGVLLPRINKPADVNNPAEGLLIYNKELKTPAFHDGSNWRMVNASSVPSTVNYDSLTYTISLGRGTAVYTGTYGLGSISLGSSDAEIPNGPVFNLSKFRDKNTAGFLAHFYGSGGSNDIVIEIKVYKKGTNTPYFSYKFKNVKIFAYSMGSSNEADPMQEAFTMTGKIFGWMDSVSGIGVAFNTTSGSIVAVDYSSF